MRQDPTREVARLDAFDTIDHCVLSHVQDRAELAQRLWLANFENPMSYKSSIHLSLVSQSFHCVLAHLACLLPSLTARCVRLACALFRITQPTPAKLDVLRRKAELLSVWLAG